jgi:hypothetical protein
VLRPNSGWALARDAFLPIGHGWMRSRGASGAGRL